MKRVLAIVMPELACEIARYRSRSMTSDKGAPPIGAIIDRGEKIETTTAVLDVVEEGAKRYGVRAGQRVVEAAALLSGLVIHRVALVEILAELGRVAEVALGFAPTAAIRLSIEETHCPDTVWLDITGAAHLAGGEEALADELRERVLALGHRARIAIASGPRIAEALARWEKNDVASLPVQALPLDPEVLRWFFRLGVLSVGDLARLPRAEVRARLGKLSPVLAAIVVDLLEGRDDTPLLPYAPPRVIDEEMSFDDPVEGTEPLLFVLRGMTSRLAARLGARGEACTLLEATIPFDRSIARLRRSNGEEDNEEERSQVSFSVELPAPLSEANDLLRALKPRLERTELPAPAIGIKLAIPQIARAPRVQLDLSRDRAVSPDNLPTLLAELSAEIGKDRIGVLAVRKAHRPEAQSVMVPVDLSPPAPVFEEETDRTKEPTRVFSEAIPISGAVKGSVIAVSGRLYAIEEARFWMRLDGVEWWTSNPCSRDYAVVLLSPGGETKPGPSSKLKGAVDVGGYAGGARSAPKPPVLEALVYVDRTNGEAYLQGYFE